jgi:tRNA modification GTPase
MNLLSGYEKSIVTPIPGTTRDIVEESVYFGGCPLNLSDTAGLRDTGDIIESIGVGRARARLDSAELVFAVFDGSRPLDGEDKAMLGLLGKKRAIAVINKSDLPKQVDKEYIGAMIKHIVEISANSGAGLEELESVTGELLATSELDTGSGIIANERQLECVRLAKEGAEAALAALEDGITLDAVSTGVEQAVAELAELTGERASQEIIDRVFEKFCVGK